MSSAPPRWIVVDDGNPLIQYQDSWVVGNSSDSPDSYFGGPYNNTLHELSGSGSFAFNFTGSSVAVMGSFSNIGDSTVPSWNCSIDGVDLIPSDPPAINRSYWELCSLKNISTNAQSLLTVVGTGTNDSPFQFDSIRYVPGPSVILDDATVLVDANDAQIKYGRRWRSFNVGMETTGNGSMMTLDFIGVQITWVSALFSNLPKTAAQFWIDNGTVFPFQVGDGGESPYALYNLVSFKSPVLNPGSHRLHVQSRGNESSAPLGLDYLLIQNRTLPTITSSPIPSTPSPTQVLTPSPSPPIDNHGGLSKGSIAAIVILSFVGLALVMFILIWVKKRKLATASLPRFENVYQYTAAGQDV